MTVRSHIVRALVATVAAATAFALTACGASGSGAPAQKAADGLVHLDWAYALTDSAPILAGIDNGVFRRHGLDVTPSEVSAADLVGGLVSGKLNLSVNTGPGLAVAVGQSVPIVAVAGVTSFATGAGGGAGSLLLVKKGSPLAKPCDLEGKKVGVNLLKSASEFGVRQLVQNAGCDGTKVKIVEVPFASVGDSLGKGDIDAALVADPFLTELLNSGKVDAPMGDPIEKVFGDEPRVVITATRAWADQNRKVIADFQAAVAESLDAAGKNPSGLLPIYQKYYKMTPEVAQATKLNAFKPTIKAGDFDVINDVLVRYGALKKPLDVSSLVAS